MPVRSLRDATLTIKSGAYHPLTPDERVIEFSNGGLSWNEKKPVTVVKNRGRVDHARLAADEKLEGQIMFLYQDQEILYETMRDIQIDGVIQKSRGQTIMAGWTNPEDDERIQAGDILFGRTVKAGDIVGSTQLTGDVDSVNLLFEINDPSTGSVGESILFMGVRFTGRDVKEGDEWIEATVDFETMVKQPHIY